MMTDKRDKIQTPQEKKAEDERLWAYVTKDTKPLKDRKKIIPINPKVIQPKEAKKRNNISQASPASKEKIKTQRPEIDGKTAEKLRKGLIPIEARLDLHGLNQNNAYDKLMQFIPSCHKKGLRCVLIITGKGAKAPLEPETGILKQRTPEWLGSAPLNQYILKIQAAKPKDGGSGALYVLLRRKRN